MISIINLPELSDKELEELLETIEDGSFRNAALREQTRRERTESADS